MRHSESADADVTEFGQIEMQLGALGWTRSCADDALIAPQLVINHGLTQTLDVIGQFELIHPPAGAERCGGRRCAAAIHGSGRRSYRYRDAGHREQRVFACPMVPTSCRQAPAQRIRFTKSEKLSCAITISSGFSMRSAIDTVRCPSVSRAAIFVVTHDEKVFDRFDRIVRRGCP